MNIKITEKLLNIPSHISTTWSRIGALHMRGGVLAITLVDGDTVHVPNLDSATITAIFEHHAAYLEKEQAASPSSSSLMSKFHGITEEEEDAPIRVAFATSFDGIGNMMQHNPNQNDAPDLPPEILQKISAIAKIVAPASDEELYLPKAEPGCNCIHCQISRALNPASAIPEAIEPEIAEEDLNFQQWNITQAGEKLYSIVNRLDEHEKYTVFLGDSIGCTCGHSGCEHILAVLRS